MAYIKTEPNEHGTDTSHHTCDVCGVEYTLTPAAVEGTLASVCMADDCPSYDPHCDIEPFFMSDQEISDEKKVVSIDVLRKRANKGPNPEQGENS